MAHCAHNQPPLAARGTQPGSSVSVLLVVLFLVVWSTLAVAQERHGLPRTAPAQLTAPTPRRPAVDVARLTTEDARMALEPAPTWQRDAHTLPEPFLRKAVEAALRPDTSWTGAEVAIRHFDLYKDRPWAYDVIAPFAIQHAKHLLLNADFFATLHRDWTKRALAAAAAHVPELVFSELKTLMAVDATWAKHLTATMASRYPALAFAHADVLLAVDRSWARGIMQHAVQGAPQKAVSMVRLYLTEPWGLQLFTEAALAVPRWTVTVADADLPESQTVVELLQRSRDPHLRLLVQIAQSGRAGDIAARMGGFVYDIADNGLSMEEAARLSKDDQTYFRTLVARKLASRASHPRVVDDALQDQATIVFQYLNELFDKPDAVRFRIIEPLTARELYTLFAYGEENAISTSYHGAFVRLLARMRQEGLTGERLLAQVNEVRLRPFIKSAAKFHRLEAFFATMPSVAERRAVLTRCFSGLERTPDIAVQAAHAAEIMDTASDDQNLRLLRETLVNEYRRVERLQDRQGLAVYGLLAAQLVQRTGSMPDMPELTSIAQLYHPYLPDWQEIPTAQLFHNGLNVQRYFFYNDEDGQGSFRSFMAQYRSASGWRVEDYGTFVRMTSSGANRQMIIYANKPTDDGERAAELERLMQQHGVPPQVIIHRGHSPYVSETIARMPRTAALVFLGNCGGYTFLQGVFNKAPEAHVITTIGVGTLTVNDPFLKALNDYLLRGKDGHWAEFWRWAATRLHQNQYFADYVAPDHNAGALLLRAYRDFTDTLNAGSPKGRGKMVLVSTGNAAR